MGKSNDLKHLQSRLAREQEMVSGLNIQLNELQAEKNTHTKKIQSLLKQLKKKTAHEIVVTEHALLRYLERVSGIPMDATEKAVLPDEARKALAGIKNGQFSVGTHQIILRNNTVVSVVTDNNTKI